MKLIAEWKERQIILGTCKALVQTKVGREQVAQE